MVGSSWNRADSNGLAPIKSPAATNTLFFCLARSCLTRVAMCSVPAGRHGDFLGFIGGISDGDAAGRRPQVTVKIVDCEDLYGDACAISKPG